MNKVQYKQGATTAWSDGEKIVIVSTAGRRWIETNVDQIFGLGEYQKICAVKYSEEVTKGKINPLSKTVEIVSGYIPERVKKDLSTKSLPGISEEDLIGEHFK